LIDASARIANKNRKFNSSLRSRIIQGNELAATMLVLEIIGDTRKKIED